MSTATAHTARLTLLGCAATVHYRFTDEHHRRLTCQDPPPALTLPGVLDALLNLPMGCPLEAGNLTGREHRMLAQAPAWSLERGAGTVTRRADVPLHLDLVTVHGPTPAPALAHASKFAPFAARTAVIDRLPGGAARTRILTEADFYGIGVATGDGTVHLPPAPYRPVRHTPARWGFYEYVYRKLTRKDRT